MGPMDISDTKDSKLEEDFQLAKNSDSEKAGFGVAEPPDGFKPIIHLESKNAPSTGIIRIGGVLLYFS